MVATLLPLHLTPESTEAGQQGSITTRIQVATITEITHSSNAVNHLTVSRSVASHPAATANQHHNVLLHHILRQAVAAVVEVLEEVAVAADSAEAAVVVAAADNTGF